MQNLSEEDKFGGYLYCKSIFYISRFFNILISSANLKIIIYKTFVHTAFGENTYCVIHSTCEYFYKSESRLPKLSFSSVYLCIFHFLLTWQSIPTLYHQFRSFFLLSNICFTPYNTLPFFNPQESKFDPFRTAPFSNSCCPSKSC